MADSNKDKQNQTPNSKSDHKRLSFLENLEKYKVADDDPDVRGWELVDKNKTRLGKVEAFLADVDQKRVRYLVVEPDEKILSDENETYQESSGEGSHAYRDRKGDVHMVVPIGMARIDEENDKVIADRIDQKTFMGSPKYSKSEGLTADREKEIREYYQDPIAHRGATKPAAGNDDTSAADNSAGAEVKSTESQPTKTVSSKDGKHEVKASAENTGESVMPDHDQREQRTEEESRKELKDKMREETDLGDDPQVREAQYREEDIENFDESRFYNRKK